jgi:hypothetical protein
MKSDQDMSWKTLDSTPCWGNRFLSSSKRPHKLWSPHSPLFTEYWQLFHLVKGKEQKADYAQSVARLRMSGAISALPYALMALMFLLRSADRVYFLIKLELFNFTIIYSIY